MDMTLKVIYDTQSPYYNTPQVNKTVTYLDFWSGVIIPVSPTDNLVTLTTDYQYRPDSLSYDFYQTPKLWWVFAIRNPNVIRDPIWDFVAGINIYIPDKTSLTRFL